MNTRRYALCNDQWQCIEHLLPGRVGTVEVTAKDDRRFVQAVFYLCRIGIPKRDLSERFGDFRMIYTRHKSWSMCGVWQQVIEVLASEVDHENTQIDSKMIRAHQRSPGAKKGVDALALFNLWMSSLKETSNIVFDLLQQSVFRWNLAR